VSFSFALTGFVLAWDASLHFHLMVVVG